MREGESMATKKERPVIPKMPRNWGKKWAENELKKAILAPDRDVLATVISNNRRTRK